MLDRIFKNNMIMGIVAVATLILTVLIFTRSSSNPTQTPAPKEGE